MRFRLALGLAVVLAACSGGGSSTPSVPSVPWAEFRHDDGNSGVGPFINRNHGNASLLVAAPGNAGATPATLPGAVTLSTPAIDHNNFIIIGTANGVAAFGPDGSERWVFEGFTGAVTPTGTQGGGCVPCTPDKSDPTCHAVGSVSASPTVTPGSAVVFGNDGTDGDQPYLFALQEHSMSVDCLWAVQEPAGTKSSAITQIYTFDLTLLSVYSAGDDGVLRALNGDGTPRWSVSPGGAEPITSTPALDANNNVYVTTPDGRLSIVTSTGVVSQQTALGPPPSEALQPTLGVGPSAYAVGSGGALFAVIPPAITKWRFAAQDPTTQQQFPITGSPAFLTQGISFQATTTTDTVIYVVDTHGTAYGVRNELGALFQTPQIFQEQRCSQDVNIDCRTDSCNPTGAMPPPPGGTCDPSTHRCAAGSGLSCTQDTCVVNNHGDCVVTDGIVSFATEPGETVSVSASPIVSGDPFVVVGTSDGRVCARSLANLVPGQSLTPPAPPWRGGHCSETTTETCVVDSDCPTMETCAAPSCDNGTCVSPGGHCSTTASQTCLDDTDCPSNETCVAAGPHCSVTTSETCGGDNNCPTDEYCVYVGCIPLTDGSTDGGRVRSSPIIGENATIYVTTDQGLYQIK